MHWKTLLHKPDFGLLLLRLGLGVFMITHGYPKITGGAATLTSLGNAMSVFGITFFPLFWGLMAALTETVGGFLIAIGWKTRLLSSFMTFLMLVAFLKHYLAGDSFTRYSRPAELGIVFLSLVFIGAGKFSIDKSSLNSG